MSVEQLAAGTLSSCSLCYLQRQEAGSGKGAMLGLTWEVCVAVGAAPGPGIHRGLWGARKSSVQVLQQVCLVLGDGGLTGAARPQGRRAVVGG